MLFVHVSEREREGECINRGKSQSNLPSSLFFFVEMISCAYSFGWLYLCCEDGVWMCFRERERDCDEERERDNMRKNSQAKVMLIIL